MKNSDSSHSRDIAKISKEFVRLSQEQQASLLKQIQKTTGADALASSADDIRPSPHEGPLPLSYGQQRLWFLDQLEPGNSAYNIRSGWRLTGDLNVVVLRDSIREIIRRHQILRTSFVISRGQPSQVISPHVEFDLPLVDLREHTAADREAELARQIAVENSRPFDLKRPGLLRARLFRLADETHVLSITIHHIVSDGWSLAIFYRELNAIYTAYAKSAKSPLPDLELQYADYSLWQRQRLTGELLDEQMNYWGKRFSGAYSGIELPFKQTRPTLQNYRGERYAVQMRSGLSDQVRAVCQREGVTPYMLLLSVFQLLLARYS